MVKILPSHAEGVGLTPGQEAKIPHTLRPKTQNIKQKQYTLILSTVWETRKLINSMSKLSSLHFLKKENRILESLRKIDILY